ncbi:TIGR03364 family FAD-dependent oxidoreductase [Cellulomonas sp. S1-8]|uniref:TIGR03364 family FAD-dependent oxidoreductase n=1 Tax=Cellulomonas sp. S1-8 TaxID=2904790 RepID=UPI00224443D2|nr:TIGR03364 family FAD-dependent oxidoreductase [Cellulomonas sp. S1-8]UZN02870.1 TIGR03364 family FAD-dependent oxidoreductase [Cellulomonas sp. S1-8]
MTAVVDLVVVGAGIVGLAHAVEASARGASVVVLDRDDRAVGASVRNFGHACITAQDGEALAYARRARGTWLQLGRTAGFRVDECGTLVVARTGEEMAALDQLAAERGPAEVDLLTGEEVAARAPVTGALGGAHLPADLRVDQRAAAGRIAAWLTEQPGAAVRWSTPVLGVEPGLVRTGRGALRASRIVVCVGHDVDRLLPEVADRAGLRRCLLQMLQLRPPAGTTIAPALLTGTSMLRYPALARTEGARALRERWQRERPELLDAGINHMLTQLPNGDLVVGDTHAYARTHDAFSAEALDDLLLAETRALLDLPAMPVVHRWQGVYADAPGEFLRAHVADGVTAVAVTSGIGMTTALGLAPAVLDSF